MRDARSDGTAVAIGGTKAFTACAAPVVGDGRAHEAGGKAHGDEGQTVANRNEKNANPPHRIHGSIRQDGCQMRWVRFAALAFVLHFAWEMGQMPLYRGLQGRPRWSIVVPCSRAALFDVAVTLALGMLFVAVARRRSSSVAPWVLTMAAGAVLAILVEKTGVGGGRWAYTVDMPMLPPLRLGLMPILQMMLIPAVSAWVTLRARRARPR